MSTERSTSDLWLRELGVDEYDVPPIGRLARLLDIYLAFPPERLYSSRVEGVEAVVMFDTHHTHETSLAIENRDADRE
jgi:hypothetical protein